MSAPTVNEIHEMVSMSATYVLLERSAAVKAGHPSRAALFEIVADLLIDATLELELLELELDLRHE